jgi:hypothetical protein
MANGVTCPECGAALPAGQTCEDVFYALQALEAEDPAYYAVHLLSVATYMIQHGRYSDEALAWIQKTMRAFLDGGQTAEQIRRAAQRETQQANRTWHVLRPAGAPPLPKIAWTMTVSDVARRQHDAASYNALVREWARVTLRQLSAGTEHPYEKR